MDFTYKITKFDAENKLVVVTFEDGHWAEIALKNPIPTNLEELDVVVSLFTAPFEVMEARANTTIDLSFIEKAIDTERTAPRLRLNPLPVAAPQPLNSPQVIL
jgi:hypothetical protein